MIITHNMGAFNTNRQLGMVTARKAKSTEKLSSGYKINRAADDAAGLTISEKMRRQIRGLNQASDNCQDGVSLVQIADGGMAEVHDMLDRCIELSVKAANGTLTAEDRNAIQKEINEIKKEIDQISDKTEFNTIKVLKGGETKYSPEINYQGGLPGWVGGGSSLGAGRLQETVTANDGVAYRGTEIDFGELTSANVSDLKDQGFYTTCCTCYEHYSVKFVEGPAQPSYKSGSNNIYEVSIDGVTTGEELVSRVVQTVGNNPNSHYTNLEANGDKLRIYDHRTEYTPGSGRNPGSGMGLAGKGVAYAKIDESTPVGISIQAGSEPDQTIMIGLPLINCTALGISGANVTTESQAKAAIDLFNHGKDYVSRERSRMGAIQNRLEHTIKNLDNVVENTTSAESRIRDTDMATEMVEFSKDNVLEQAGQAMLAQANQSTQGILNLLQ